MQQSSLLPTQATGGNVKTRLQAKLNAQQSSSLKNKFVHKAISQPQNDPTS